MTNVLMTGCTGFIGSNLTSKLVEKGYTVYGLVRYASRRELDSLGCVIDKVHLIEGDLTAFHSMITTIGSVQPQVVVHLGALTPVRLSFDDPFPYLSINYEGTVNLVHAMLEKAPKARLVYASTAEVYGWQNQNKPFKEDLALNPASPYAVSKEAADQYVRMAMKVYNLNATALRPINTYGRKGEKGFLVEYLVSTMLRNEACYLGAPGSVRDYMFIDDHVNAYLLAIEKTEANQKVFNVSPGNPVTNNELANIVQKATEFNGRIVRGSYPPGYPQRPAIHDPSYLVLDSTKIRKTLGWKPSVTLSQGIAKVVDIWKQNSGGKLY